jgi:hypothetical protein
VASQSVDAALTAFGFGASWFTPMIVRVRPTTPRLSGAGIREESIQDG